MLVTGGTGYVGAFLCRALAEREDVSEVIAVVRAADDDKASTRLRGNCEARLGELGDWYAKIRAVAGKLDAENFGLSIDLVETLDVVVHGAAEVNMVKPPSLLEASNVGGTKLAAELALRAKAPLLFTSTMLPPEGEAVKSECQEVVEGWFNFVTRLRALMDTDTRKEYLITAVPINTKFGDPSSGGFGGWGAITHGHLPGISRCHAGFERNSQG